MPKPKRTNRQKLADKMQAKALRGRGDGKPAHKKKLKNSKLA